MTNTRQGDILWFSEEKMSLHEQLIKECQKAFKDSLLSCLRLESINKVIPVPLSEVTKDNIHEYADYLEFNTEDAVKKAEFLGAGCAILYNTLIKDAILTCGHKIVVDLLAEDNLHINVVTIDEPSVCDPMGLVLGWISFRFHFKSANTFPKSLVSKDSIITTLKNKGY